MDGRPVHTTVARGLTAGSRCSARTVRTARHDRVPAQSDHGSGGRDGHLQGAGLGGWQMRMLKRGRSSAVLDESARAHDQVDDRHDNQRPRRQRARAAPTARSRRTSRGWAGPLAAESRAPSLGCLDVSCGELAVVGQERDPCRRRQDREAEGCRSRHHVRQCPTTVYRASIVALSIVQVGDDGRGSAVNADAHSTGGSAEPAWSASRRSRLTSSISSRSDGTLRIVRPSGPGCRSTSRTAVVSQARRSASSRTGSVAL